MDRPVRLRFDGQVESYDFTSNAWILDRSRDYRENIPITIPPAAPDSIAVTRSTTANAIAYQLRQSLIRQKSAWVDETSLIETYWEGVLYAITGSLTQRANFDWYANYLSYGLLYRISAYWWQSTGLRTQDEPSAEWDKVVCYMWCAIGDDGLISFDAWLAMVAAIQDDVSLDEFGSWLRWMVILLGRKGLINIGRLAINEADVIDPSTDCEPCP